MGTPYLGEIKLVSFNFAPKGWALCNGQLLPINQNQALFALFGTMYGGNGTTSFALPNLQSRVPIHVGGGHTQGQQAGEENHTLNASELPGHTHVAQASSAEGNAVTPSTDVVLASPLNLTYRAQSGLSPMDPGSVAAAGGSQPHTNQQPYLTLNFIVALQGIFPSQN